MLSFASRDGRLRTGGLVFLDSHCIATNASTVGQLLMMKRLSAPPAVSKTVIGFALKEKPSTLEGGYEWRLNNEAHQRKANT